VKRSFIDPAMRRVLIRMVADDPNLRVETLPNRSREITVRWDHFEFHVTSKGPYMTESAVAVRVSGYVLRKDGEPRADRIREVRTVPDGTAIPDYVRDEFLREIRDRAVIVREQATDIVATAEQAILGFTIVRPTMTDTLPVTNRTETTP
jgi:hypothetical protein